MSDAALRIDRLVKEYRRGVPVLKDVSLEIAARGVTAIIGASGTGKSTLIRCINRLVEPTSGAIHFDGHDLTRLSRGALRAARRRIGMVVPEFNLVERLTVMENLLSGRLGYVPAWKAWLRRFPQEDIARAFALLDEVGLAGFAHQRADSLSGGQRQRVGIARALMQSPALLLADEPTSSLDPKTAVEIMQLLRDAAAHHQIPVLINMHDVDLARRFADRVIGLAGGHVVFDGPAERLTDDELTRIYGGKDWLQ
jgi:phosphonate transport system ATP-binding protein